MPPLLRRFAGPLRERLREANAATSNTALLVGDTVKRDDLKEAAPKACPDCTDGKTETGGDCTTCDGIGTITATKETERPALETFVALREVSRTDQTTDEGRPVYIVTVLREGFGNGQDGNYYTREGIQSLVDSELLDGAKSYSNHPTRTMERELPERSVDDLRGYYRNPFFVIENGVAKAKAEFCPAEGEQGDKAVALIETALRASADGVRRQYAGISIDGGGTTMLSEVDGRPANLVTKFTHLFSADLVTEPGAGGEFERRLTESLRGLPAERAQAHTIPSPQEDTMKIETLQERLKAATAKLREAATTEDVGAAVTELEELQATEIDKPEPVKVEVRESAAPAPVTPDPKVAELETKLREAEAREAAEKQRADDAESKVGQTDRIVAAHKVLREAEVPEADFGDYAPDLIERYATEAEMAPALKRTLTRESRLRESIVRDLTGQGIEGAGGRPPLIAAGPDADAQAMAKLRESGIPVKEPVKEPETAAA